MGNKTEKMKKEMEKLQVSLKNANKENERLELVNLALLEENKIWRGLLAAPKAPPAPPPPSTPPPSNLFQLGIMKAKWLKDEDLREVAEKLKNLEQTIREMITGGKICPGKIYEPWDRDLVGHAEATMEEFEAVQRVVEKLNEDNEEYEYRLVCDYDETIPFSRISFSFELRA